MQIKTAAELKKMSIDQLESYRNRLSQEYGKLTVASRAAGVVKSEKIAATPRARGQAKIAEGREIIALATAKEAEANG